jgi:hypothetical protein
VGRKKKKNFKPVSLLVTRKNLQVASVITVGRYKMLELFSRGVRTEERICSRSCPEPELLSLVSIWNINNNNYEAIRIFG